MLGQATPRGRKLPMIATGLAPNRTSVPSVLAADRSTVQSCPAGPCAPTRSRPGGVVVRRAGSAMRSAWSAMGGTGIFPRATSSPVKRPRRRRCARSPRRPGSRSDPSCSGRRCRRPSTCTAAPITARLVFKRVHHFIIEAPEGLELHPDPAEIAEAGWFGFDAAKARLTFRNSISVLDAARSLLEREPPRGAPSSAP